MDDILDEMTSAQDLKKFEREYNITLLNGNLDPKVQFQYAWCLVRSKYSSDIYKGILLLKNLLDTSSMERRDCMYYLAIGHARIKEYNKALEYINLFSTTEPGNTQIEHLESLIRNKLREKRDRNGSLIAIAGITSLISIFLMKK
ncbi:PREDICTED: mitochondrial fission 1 protein [Ceratosolen solmsi marchali]|uniref:Mitochondrial fission 1 protein n=1 Tax=Ceratosolen solmsi marchali TaxID=326594 RepID=A0AAJ6YFM1_9HYME|nr:PREDICTED: mitochondrial fission 1 protein [Ceratosolen solmsi marchali]